MTNTGTLATTFLMKGAKTSVAKAMKVLRKLRCLQIEVGIVQSLCRNDCHQVILLGQVLEIVE